MSSVTNRNVVWTQMAWENYFLSTMFLICFLSLLIALKRGEVDVECSLIVICFLLKGHLCHSLNICISLSSSWTQKSPPSSLIYFVDLSAETPWLFNIWCFFSQGKKKKKKLSVNKVFLLQCVLCLPPTWHLTSEREAEYWPASFYTSWTRCFRFISAKIKRRQKSCFRSRGKKIKINHV